MRKTIYIVTASQGKYELDAVYQLRAFAGEEKAKAHMEQLTARVAEMQKIARGLKDMMTENNLDEIFLLPSPIDEGELRFYYRSIELEE